MAHMDQGKQYVYVTQCSSSSSSCHSQIILLASGWSRELGRSPSSPGSHTALHLASCPSAVQLFVVPAVWDTTGGHAPLFACQFHSCSLWTWSVGAQAHLEVMVVKTASKLKENDLFLSADVVVVIHLCPRLAVWLDDSTVSPVSKCITWLTLTGPNLHKLISILISRDTIVSSHPL